MSCASLLGKLNAVVHRPVVRGMLVYAVLWPASNVVKQLIEGATLETIDWKRCVRFGVYGTFFVAPVLYGWMRLWTGMWPTPGFKGAVTKALVEQISYGPYAVFSFYIGMNLLEFKSLAEGFDEFKKKFWPTWSIGMWVWPIIQTVNYSLVPEKNRVVFVGFVSFLWVIFLAHMKQLQLVSERRKVRQS